MLRVLWCLLVCIARVVCTRAWALLEQGVSHTCVYQNTRASDTIQVVPEPSSPATTRRKCGCWSAHTLCPPPLCSERIFSEKAFGARSWSALVYIYTKSLIYIQYLHTEQGNDKHKRINFIQCSCVCASRAARRWYRSASATTSCLLVILMK